MTKKFKAAIIGCGMIAGKFESLDSMNIYSHGKAYSKNDSFSELAFFDTDNEASAFLAEKFSGKQFFSIEEMLSQFKPDVVSICSPDHFHFSSAMAVFKSLNRPKILFVEKPLCGTFEELIQLERFSSESKVPLIVNHSRRFDFAHQQLKALIDRQELGELSSVWVNYYGGWCHLGVHLVDILQYLFTTELNITSASFCCESKYKQDPTLNVNGEINHHPLHFIGHDENYYQLVEMDFFFQKGRIRIEDFGQEIRVCRKTVNNEQENILILDEGLSLKGMQNQMANAIEIISEYLVSNNPSRLEYFNITNAKKTMSTLWKGVKLYENGSFKK